METDFQSAKYLLFPKRIVKHLRLFSESDLKTYLGILDSLNFESKKAFLTLTSLAQLVGLSTRSVNKSVLRLVAFGYIKYYPSHAKEGKSCFVVIHSFPEKKSTLERSEISHEKSQTFPKIEPNFQLTKAKIRNVPINNLNNNKETDNDIYKNKGKEWDSKGEENPKEIKFIPKSKEDLLALEISEVFGDRKLLPLLVFYCKKYPESIIRRAFSETKQIPKEKIKKSKIALFIYLLHKNYAQEFKSSPKNQNLSH